VCVSLEGRAMLTGTLLAEEVIWHREVVAE
jgi:hypothetical protein